MAIDSSRLSQTDFWLYPHDRAHREECLALLENFLSCQSMVLTTSAVACFLDVACPCRCKHPHDFVEECAKRISPNSQLTVRRQRLRDFGPKSVIRLLSLVIPRECHALTTANLRDARPMTQDIRRSLDRLFIRWGQHHYDIEKRIASAPTESLPYIWAHRNSDTDTDWDTVSRKLVVGIAATKLKARGIRVVSDRYFNFIRKHIGYTGIHSFTPFVYCHRGIGSLGLACGFSPATIGIYTHYREQDRKRTKEESPLSVMSLLDLEGPEWLSRFETWRDAITSKSRTANVANEYVIDLYTLTKAVELSSDLSFTPGEYIRLDGAT
ncbi:hypothetical protein Pla108_27000 [Botrimarina colliarenosi]|uniref:Uncharacterized protein n=1 Tax=Botrimarina colliarenosi TaxID=2528001 RepID=A0A5C6AA77_9BACT|nr:hypothetical protein Pla108_27000 [Botrimarina colliarenosi]